MRLPIAVATYGSETLSTELSHFVAGQHLAGTSGRFADVFDPNTGGVQARVPLASKAEVVAAIDDAERAQLEWAAWNPQRRARVLLRFLDLVNRDMESLARTLSSEHGKTVADAKGDIQRGLEVIEFAAGGPHLLKGSTRPALVPASTSTRCVSRLVWLLGSRRSTSRR